LPDILAFEFQITTWKPTLNRFMITAGSRVADFWERFHRAEKLNALYKINNINIKKLTL